MTGTIFKVKETKNSAPVRSLLLRLSLLDHTEAFEKAEILHCDISIGNIIINDRGGLLIDWDLSNDIKDLEKISRQPFRYVSLDFENPNGLYIMTSRCPPLGEHGSLFQLGCYKPGGQQCTPKLMTGSLFFMFCVKQSCVLLNMDWTRTSCRIS